MNCSQSYIISEFRDQGWFSGKGEWNKHLQSAIIARFYLDYSLREKRMENMDGWSSHPLVFLFVNT